MVIFFILLFDIKYGRSIISCEEKWKEKKLDNIDNNGKNNDIFIIIIINIRC